MQVKARVTVEHAPSLPGGVPALWVDRGFSGHHARHVVLYVLEGLPPGLEDRFRVMAARDVLDDTALRECTARELPSGDVEWVA